MNYGLYLSASGMLTSMYRQDVLTNNLANSQTVGFKVDVPTVRHRDAESIEDNLGMDVSHDLLDRLGGGALAGRQRISFAAGAPQQTRNPFDVMLAKPDQFLAMAVTNPGKDGKTSGNMQVMLTRDGRLATDGQGYLVSAATGHKVLNSQDLPIQIANDAPVEINTRGEIVQNGEIVDTLQVAQISDLDVLRKFGQNLFAWKGKDDPRQPATNPDVRSGFIESSGADAISTLMNLVNATKAVNNNATLLRYQDQLMDRAVNTLGRTA
ncbi:MAG: hypothetical protein IT440_10395 [Phycisphaeraceae bacterium]|nr:hypothetical protein [Phycisphaeraceae bacterium]